MTSKTQLENIMDIILKYPNISTKTVISNNIDEKNIMSLLFSNSFVASDNQLIDYILLKGTLFENIPTQNKFYDYNYKIYTQNPLRNINIVDLDVSFINTQNIIKYYFLLDTLSQIYGNFTNYLINNTLTIKCRYHIDEDIWKLYNKNDFFTFVIRYQYDGKQVNYILENVQSGINILMVKQMISLIDKTITQHLRYINNTDLRYNNKEYFRNVEIFYRFCRLKLKYYSLQCAAVFDNNVNKYINSTLTYCFMNMKNSITNVIDSSPLLLTDKIVKTKEEVKEINNLIESKKKIIIRKTNNTKQWNNYHIDMMLYITIFITAFIILITFTIHNTELKNILGNFSDILLVALIITIYFTISYFIGLNVNEKFENNVCETFYNSPQNYPKGLRFRIYNGYFNDDTNWFMARTPTNSGTTTDIGTISLGTANIVPLNNSREFYSVEWFGYFYANVTGRWTFYTSSDDASYLWIGNTALIGYNRNNAVVNNGGLHGMREISGTIDLVQGMYYPIRIQFGENTGGDNMSVSWIPPGGSRTYSGNYFLDTPYGLSFKIYNNYFNDDVTFFKRSTPTNTGITADISNIYNGTNTIIPLNNSREFYSVEWFGYFYANVTGRWTFYVSSDDASYLWIGPNAETDKFVRNNAVVNNGGLHPWREMSGTIDLVKDTYYPIRIQFGENTEGDNISVSWMPPNGGRIYSGFGYFFDKVVQPVSENQGISNELLSNMVKFPQQAMQSNTTNINGLTVRCKASTRHTSWGDVWALFNSNKGDEGSGSYHTNFAYNNGIATITYFPSYAGECIMIDLGTTIILKQIGLTVRGGFTDRCPGIFRIYATNDVNKFNNNDYTGWDLIHNQISKITNYRPNVSTLINIINNMPYSIYAIVINVLSGNSTILNFAEWELYGTEVSTTTNLMPWYTFNDNLTNMLLDSSGYNFNLTNYGARFDSNNYKTGNGSIYFRKSRYVELPSSINPFGIWFNNGITFALWFRMSPSSGTWARILDFSEGTSGNPARYLVICRNGNSDRLFIGSSIQNYVTTMNLVDNKWHHIVWSISSLGVWSLYIDGTNININITNINTIANVTYGRRYLGRSAFAQDGWYKGNIDDFRIYNRVLTSNEVKAVFTNNDTYVSLKTAELPKLPPPPASIPSELYDNNLENVISQSQQSISMKDSDEVLNNFRLVNQYMLSLNSSDNNLKKIADIENQNVQDIETLWKNIQNLEKTSSLDIIERFTDLNSLQKELMKKQTLNEQNIKNTEEAIQKFHEESLKVFNTKIDFSKSQIISERDKNNLIFNDIAKLKNQIDEKLPKFDTFNKITKEDVDRFVLLLDSVQLKQQSDLTLSIKSIKNVSDKLLNEYLELNIYHLAKNVEKKLRELAIVEKQKEDIIKKSSQNIFENFISAELSSTLVNKQKIEKELINIINNSKTQIENTLSKMYNDQTKYIQDLFNTITSQRSYIETELKNTPLTVTSTYVKSYPPISEPTSTRGNNTNTTFNFGQDQYIVATSTSQQNSPSRNLIDNNFTTAWKSAPNLYKPQYTGNNLLANINGEWIIYRLPFQINLTSYVIKSSQNRPNTWNFYASNDGEKWDYIDNASQNTNLTATNYVFDSYTKNVSKINPYLYFAILVTSITDDTLQDKSCSISDIRFNGELPWLRTSLSYKNEILNSKRKLLNNTINFINQIDNINDHVNNNITNTKKSLNVEFELLQKSYELYTKFTKLQEYKYHEDIYSIKTTVPDIKNTLTTNIHTIATMIANNIITSSLNSETLEMNQQKDLIKKLDYKSDSAYDDKKHSEKIKIATSYFILRLMMLTALFIILSRNLQKNSAFYFIFIVLYVLIFSLYFIDIIKIVRTDSSNVYWGKPSAVEQIQ